MHHRLMILAVVLLAAVGGLSWLGFRAIDMQADGLEGRRVGEFAAVAEQVRRDINRKLEEFIQAEEARPYTDYQYYYVPENVANMMNVQQQAPLLRSPLSTGPEHGLAYGHFQIEPDRSITTPYYDCAMADAAIDQGGASGELAEYLGEIKENIAVRLNGASGDVEREPSREKKSEKVSAMTSRDTKTVVGWHEGPSRGRDADLAGKDERTGTRLRKRAYAIDKEAVDEPVSKRSDVSKTKRASYGGKAENRRGKALAIKGLQRDNQKTQIITQSRSVAEMNVLSNEMQGRSSQMSSSRQRQAGVVAGEGGADRAGDARGASHDISMSMGMGPGMGMTTDGRQSPGVASPTPAGVAPGSPAAPRAELEGGVRLVAESASSTVRNMVVVESPQQTDEVMLLQQVEETEQAADSFEYRARRQSQGGPQAQSPRTVSDTQQDELRMYYYQDSTQSEQDDTVQVRIEPFSAILVGGPTGEKGMFGGDVFMVRHVQIEDRHLLQGFRLDENRLWAEVKESARRFVREGMCYEVSQVENDDAAYTAILDFEFGDVVLNLMEMDPAWIGKQTGQLRNWYFSIIVIVFMVVGLGLVSLWRNLREQVKLAQQKDDFISAVSHELRTPLTSIRMYTEMLEKNWIKSDGKRDEYYRSMRLESERLSRLVENVLDFSRLQRGRKRYEFRLGDVNECVGRVVEMMRPYAEQAGFVVETELAADGQSAFDNDAVMQIVINLIDNAVKYAHGGEEKKIIVRTKRDGAYVLVEVEDHGPGLAYRERKRVFDEFYRCEDEGKQGTAGVGLGLSLVRRFALAHNGFVEIMTAQPSGAVFRVALAAQV